MRANSPTIVDAQLSYDISANTRLRLDIFNLFNAQTNDITYYYTSRLPGEPAKGVNDNATRSLAEYMRCFHERVSAFADLLRT